MKSSQEYQTQKTIFMKSLIYGKSSSLDREIFYVSIDNIEMVNENSYQIIFDGIQTEKIKFFNTSQLLDSYDEFTPYLFSVIVSELEYQRIAGFFKHTIFKSKWFQLITTKWQTNMPVSVVTDSYVDGESNSEEKYISSIKQLHSKSSVSKILNKYFSWNSFKLSDKAGVEESIKISGNSDRDLIHKLNIYNVGQGNLTAITDASNTPLLYFDLGGGFAWNKKTYANTLQLCFNETKTVVISHWDNDHLETAKRYFKNDPSKLMGITWIVPEQKITPSYFKLAAKMNASGNLIIWPKSLRGSISFWFGKLIKCNGPDKNHSGLALVVESPNNSITKVLNPGDAAYKYIPGSRKIKFDGLVVTHHGANFDDNNFPLPLCENGNIAYSYGVDNTYNHPRTPAIDAHNAHGWTNRKDTINAHISFTTSDRDMDVPCASSFCNLEISQTF